MKWSRMTLSSTHGVLFVKHSLTYSLLPETGTTEDKKLYTVINICNNGEKLSGSKSNEGA